MIKKTTFACMVNISLFLLFVSVPGLAQERLGKAAVSDEELTQAAKAHVKIMEIQENFQQSLREAGPDYKKVQALQEAANKKMTQAVEEEGLELQMYDKIIQTVKADADLKEEFMRKVKEFQDK
ncbi:MAG: DUF4168 domain-containing protein [Deltaproteobacteria bacterium]|nr:DUF4168 domain-containing protein [Deltaproteobacteria bacterium]